MRGHVLMSVVFSILDSASVARKGQRLGVIFFGRVSTVHRSMFLFSFRF